jgi:hypothetical protein
MELGQGPGCRAGHGYILRERRRAALRVWVSMGGNTARAGPGGFSAYSRAECLDARGLEPCARNRPKSPNAGYGWVTESPVYLPPSLTRSPTHLLPLPPSFPHPRLSTWTTVSWAGGGEGAATAGAAASGAAGAGAGRNCGIGNEFKISLRSSLKTSFNNTSISPLRKSSKTTRQECPCIQRQSESCKSESL